LRRRKGKQKKKGSKYVKVVQDAKEKLLAQ
jgi:hypothetical protein